jgi:hypothetical protein
MRSISRKTNIDQQYHHHDYEREREIKIYEIYFIKE